MAKNRRSSMLSFTGKNRKISSGTIPKVDAAETAKEKAAFHINTKADPTKAINEAQPCMCAEQYLTKMKAFTEVRQRHGMLSRPPRSNPFEILSIAMQRGTSSVRDTRTTREKSVANAVTADPDLSNPTRPRMERPLDTIRSFEAAIDGSYNRRASFRAGTTSCLRTTSLPNTMLIGIFYRVGESHESSEQSPKWLFHR